MELSLICYLKLLNQTSILLVMLSSFDFDILRCHLNNSG
jgi:hypothetical protein